MTTDFLLIGTPHIVPQESQVWEDAKAHYRTAFLRCANAEDDNAEQPRLDTEGRITKGKAGRLEQAMRTAWLRTKRQSAETHLSDDTCETQHCFTEQSLRIHVGFTHEDATVGWRQVLSSSTSLTPDIDTLARIEQAKSGAVLRLEPYWVELANVIDIQCVIYQGVHYTWNVLGGGIGLGGQAFRVERLTVDREPTECNLFAQSRISVWMRDRLPDNVRTIEDSGYRINPFPAMDGSLDDDPPYQPLGVPPVGSDFRAVRRTTCDVSPFWASVPDASASYRRCALCLPGLKAASRNFRARKFRLWI